MLDRNAILSALDLPPAAVPVPEWGAEAVVYVRTLTAAEADLFKDADKRKSFLGWFAALVLCDEHGARLFSEADADLLAQKPIRILTRICDAAQRHNGMTKDAQEDLEKNSETIRAGSSGSTSPAS